MRDGPGSVPTPAFFFEQLKMMIRALTVIVCLFATAPAWGQDVGALFRTGLAAVEASQVPGVSDEKRDTLLDKAIAAFRRILIFQPDLARPRLELARAFFLKGEDNLARQHFERVLASEQPEAVAKNVQRYLDAIRARRRWDAHFGFALAPDSNVNAASSEEIVFLYGLPFTVNDESKPSSGVGLILWGGAEYEHPLSERFELRA